MKDGAYAYFVCVDGTANSNKFYEMKQISRSEFRATWGREDGNRKPGTKIYSMWKWDEVYRKRVNKSRSKPYTDVTHLRAVEVAASSAGEPAAVSAIQEDRIRQLIIRLQGHARGSVTRNYKVAAEAVTQAQIDEAQRILDDISGLVYTPDTRASNGDINRLLEELYTVIPRKMKQVSDHMLERWQYGLDVAEAKGIFNLEQANIDVMAQQVRASARAKAPARKTDPEQKSILDAMGITMRLATDDEVRIVKGMTQGQASLVGTVFAVENQATATRFNENMANIKAHGLPEIHSRLARYWHGSRTENWLGILDAGLLVRPPQATSTGNMFGIGIYFADKFQKSLNYTSHHRSYYTGGNENRGYLAIFDVNIGKQYEVGRHSHSCYDLSSRKLKQLGNYDSTWGKSGPSLLNNEYVVYSSSQCTVAYLVEVI
jgi:poly [ADP-ribose] polymerase